MRRRCLVAAFGRCRERVVAGGYLVISSSHAQASAIKQQTREQTCTNTLHASCSTNRCVTRHSVEGVAQRTPLGYTTMPGSRLHVCFSAQLSRAVPSQAALEQTLCSPISHPFPNACAIRHHQQYPQVDATHGSHAPCRNNAVDGSACMAGTLVYYIKNSTSSCHVLNANCTHWEEPLTPTFPACHAG